MNQYFLFFNKFTPKIMSGRCGYTDKNLAIGSHKDPYCDSLLSPPFQLLPGSATTASVNAALLFPLTSPLLPPELLLFPSLSSSSAISLDDVQHHSPFQNICLVLVLLPPFSSTSWSWKCWGDSPKWENMAHWVIWTDIPQVLQKAMRWCWAEIVVPTGCQVVEEVGVWSTLCVWLHVWWEQIGFTPYCPRQWWGGKWWRRWGLWGIGSWTKYGTVWCRGLWH